MSGCIERYSLTPTLVAQLQPKPPKATGRSTAPDWPFWMPIASRIGRSVKPMPE
jgi:hypothetical protein